jgi:hypothetical protein
LWRLPVFYPAAGSGGHQYKITQSALIYLLGQAQEPERSIFLEIVVDSEKVVVEAV